MEAGRTPACKYGCVGPDVVFYAGASKICKKCKIKESMKNKKNRAAEAKIKRLDDWWRQHDEQEEKRRRQEEEDEELVRCYLE